MSEYFELDRYFTDSEDEEQIKKDDVNQDDSDDASGETDDQPNKEGSSEDDTPDPHYQHVDSFL